MSIHYNFWRTFKFIIAINKNALFLDIMLRKYLPKIEHYVSSQFVFLPLKPRFDRVFVFNFPRIGNKHLNFTDSISRSLFYFIKYKWFYIFNFRSRARKADMPISFLFWSGLRKKIEITQIYVWKRSDTDIIIKLIRMNATCSALSLIACFFMIHLIT
jgi:alpha-N-acetylglucosamine transferase